MTQVITPLRQRMIDDMRMRKRDEPVQTFQAFTSDLQRMADSLVATGTRTVVMESTGVYWVAAYEVLESRGLEVILANAREARAVAQWLLCLVERRAIAPRSGR
jgi:transposase